MPTQRDTEIPAVPTHPWSKFRLWIAKLRDLLGFGPPEVVAGRYELRRDLPPSGMGRVSKALDRKTGGYVAVKRMREGLQGAAARERFRREANLGRLPFDSGILMPLDVGADFFTTEWIEGPNFAEYLAAQGLDLNDCLGKFRQAVRLVTSLHHEGVAHRDLKPANFMVKQATGQMHLLDFGLVHNPREETLTLSGEVMGTQRYMDPVHGGRRNPDPLRSDVYSLGVMFYEILAGSPACSLDGAPSRHQATPDHRFDLLVLAAISLNPDDRPRNAQEFLSWLDSCLAATDHRQPVPRPEGIAAAAASVPSRAKPRRRKSGLRRVVGYAYGLAVLGGIAVASYPRLPENWRNQGELAWEKLRHAFAATQGGEQGMEPGPDGGIIGESLPNTVLTVQGTPTGANIMLTGARGVKPQEFNVEGPEPRTYTVPAEEYAYVVTAPGYCDSSGVVDCRTGPQTLRFDLARRKGVLEVTTQPGVEVVAVGPDGVAQNLGRVGPKGVLTDTSLVEGPYTAKLTLADHAPGEMVIRIEDGNPYRLILPLRPLDGWIRVTGHEAVKVIVAGKEKGAANAKIPLAAGLQDVTFSRPGFRSETVTVNVPPNDTLPVKCPDLVQESGRLEVSVSVPARAQSFFSRAAAQVSLDDGPWMKVNLPWEAPEAGCGRRRVALKVEGFQVPEPLSVEVVDRQSTTAPFVLEVAPAKVVVQCILPHAEVFQGGKRLGLVGQPVEVPALASGEVTVQAEGFGPETVAFGVLNPDSTNTLKVSLKPTQTHAGPRGMNSGKAELPMTSGYKPGAEPGRDASASGVHPTATATGDSPGNLAPDRATGSAGAPAVRPAAAQRRSPSPVVSNSVPGASGDQNNQPQADSAGIGAVSQNAGDPGASKPTVLYKGARLKAYQVDEKNYSIPSQGSAVVNTIDHSALFQLDSYLAAPGADAFSRSNLASKWIGMFYAENDGDYMFMADCKTSFNGGKMSWRVDLGGVELMSMKSVSQTYKPEIKQLRLSRGYYPVVVWVGDRRGKHSAFLKITCRKPGTVEFIEFSPSTLFYQEE